MATTSSKHPKKREVAKLVTENRQPCVFCNADVDDEVIYGKLYALGDIQCHYFCVLLSCCLMQKGRDEEGLFGFLYKDILAEVERSKKHKCSYCGRGGASLGCAVSACRKQFHLPCGRRKNAVSLFYGNYKSFCELHAPKQKISEDVMAKAKERMKRDRLIKAGKIPSVSADIKQADSSEDPALLCVICYEDVQAFPTTQTFWPPCCGRDAWLHRNCLQRMALSAGMHYLKCPLCNDKDNFYDAVCEQGYYLPDRDAAWELEQNAFAEIYNRDAECAAPECKCPFGRSHDELGMWDIKLCLLCGSWGMHSFCSGGERPVCGSCRPAAQGIEQLESRLTEVILAEQAREQRQRSGRVMPARMSLRRTKGGTPKHSASSSSQHLPALESTQNNTETPSPTKDRLELNLKTPRRPKLLTPNLKEIESKLLSPIKMLEQSYLEKGGGGDVVVTSEVIEKIRLKFSKPKPLSAKKKIVNEILDDLFKSMFKESCKSKDPLKEWNSPRKSCDVTSGRNEVANDNSEHFVNTLEKESPVNPEGTIEEVEINDSEVETNKNDDTCDKESHQDIDTISEEKSKTDEIDESSKKDGRNNLNDNDEICDTIDDRSDDESRSTFQLPSDKESHQDIDTISEEISKTDEIDESSKKDGQNNLNDNDETCDTIDDNSDDESSRSTFQLPSDFVAENEDSLPILDTPKKLRTVDMKQESSIETSENSEVLNIDVLQIGSGDKAIKNKTLKTPAKKRVYSFKFSPLYKEPITENVDMDVESFKDQYLNEVDRKSCVNLNNDVLRNVDVNVDTGRKRKLEMKGEDNGIAKKRKKNRDRKLKLKIKIKSSDKKEKRAKKMRKIKEQMAKGIRIKLKEGRKKKQKVKSYKQYVLKYSPLITSNVIAKPEVDVTPMKRKYTKLEKPPDNLVQTSIQSFFKAK